MRDNRKTAFYFDAYIAYENERISKKLNKLESCNDVNKAGRIYSSLFLYRMNILIASFSNGAGKDDLERLHEEACSTALSIDKLTYSDALSLSSIAIILNNFSAIKPVIERFNGEFATDKLLHGLETFIEAGVATWQGEYKFPDVYSGLDAVILADSKEAKEDKLLSYLTEWYSRCKDCSWYDTHESNNDTYYGYWCFEGAALSVIFQLDNAHLSQNEYFPAL